MELTRSMENYLETLYRLRSHGIVKTSDLSSRMNVRPASVTQMLKRLHEMGLVIYHPYMGAELTEEGREIAEMILRRHMILECFFHNVLGMDLESSYEEASRMKHELFGETEAALRRYLRNPSRCPHGIPIP